MAVFRGRYLSDYKEFWPKIGILEEGKFGALQGYHFWAKTLFSRWDIDLAKSRFQKTKNRARNANFSKNRFLAKTTQYFSKKFSGFFRMKLSRLEEKFFSKKKNRFFENFFWRTEKKSIFRKKFPILENGPFSEKSDFTVFFAKFSRKKKFSKFSKIFWTFCCGEKFFWKMAQNRLFLPVFCLSKIKKIEKIENLQSKLRRIASGQQSKLFKIARWARKT